MSDNEIKDYYEVLGVGKAATISEIHQAYWQLASRYHPDKGGSHEQMVRLVEAWKILSDPANRARYDQLVKYRHDGWRSRQHNDAVREALRRAKDDAARSWPEFEAIYQKAFYTFNQDFYGEDINGKAAGPYSPLLRPQKSAYRLRQPGQSRPPIQTAPAVGSMLFIYTVKVIILLAALSAALFFYHQYTGVGRFINLGQQGVAAITVLDTATGAVYSVEKPPGALFYSWRNTVPPVSKENKP